jgi:hypothetical protein
MISNYFFTEAEPEFL